MDWKHLCRIVVINNSGGNIMSDRDKMLQERRLDEVLNTDLDAVSKVQRVMRLGFTESAASRLVERHQLGLQMPVFYEHLDLVDDDRYSYNTRDESGR